MDEFVMALVFVLIESIEAAAWELSNRTNILLDESKLEQQVLLHLTSI